jgi:hypothetical protein
MFMLCSGKIVMKTIELKTVAVGFGIVALAVGAGFVGFALHYKFGPTAAAQAPSTYSMSYADLVAVLLSAAALLLTLLGFGIAILAFVGWNSIAAHAETVARKSVEESLKKNKPLYKIVASNAVDATNTFLKVQFSQGGEMQRLVTKVAERSTYEGVDGYIEESVDQNYEPKEEEGADD